VDWRDLHADQNCKKKKKKFDKLRAVTWQAHLKSPGRHHYRERGIPSDRQRWSRLCCNRARTAGSDWEYLADGIKRWFFDAPPLQPYQPRHPIPAADPPLSLRLERS
jgi:hypothetical protein